MILAARRGAMGHAPGCSVLEHRRKKTFAKRNLLTADSA